MALQWRYQRFCYSYYAFWFYFAIARPDCKKEHHLFEDKKADPQPMCEPAFAMNYLKK